MSSRVNIWWHSLLMKNSNVPNCSAHRKRETSPIFLVLSLILVSPLAAWAAQYDLNDIRLVYPSGSDTAPVRMNFRAA